MLAPVLHLILHVAVPAAVAWVWFRERFGRAFGIMLLTMAVDLDHLWADPIYDPDRCSIGTHTLHTAPFVVLYVVLTLVPATRLVGLGLVIHMALDAIDCGVQTWGAG